MSGVYTIITKKEGNHDCIEVWVEENSDNNIFQIIKENKLKTLEEVSSYFKKQVYVLDVCPFLYSSLFVFQPYISGVKGILNIDDYTRVKKIEDLL